MFVGHHLLSLLGFVYLHICRFQFTGFKCYKLSRLQKTLILFFAQLKNLCVFLDDDIDSNNLPDDELEVYFNKLMPPAMQRGRVEGQELPATVRHSVPTLLFQVPLLSPSVFVPETVFLKVPLFIFD